MNNKLILFWSFCIVSMTCVAQENTNDGTSESEYGSITKETKTEKTKLTFSFPAHSFTQIKVVVKN